MSQGYFGYVGFGARKEPPLLLEETASRFLHDSEGPGEYSSARGELYSLGMRRTVIDKKQQTATIRRDELNAVAAIHGEFHNLSSLFDESINGDDGYLNDLDQILALYHREGPSFARKLNGLFSIVIIDESEESCFLFNDRFGMARQVYWTVIDGCLFFATHLRSLLSFPHVEREVNPEGLNIFLKYSYISSPWTIFRGIQKLPPGHLLTFREGKAEVSAYWDFSQTSSSVSTWDEAISTYRTLLQQSIALRLGTVSRTGIFLSGGLDSSANVALAARCTDEQLNTFAIGFEDPRFDERPYARIVAKHFNTRHHEYTITGSEIEALPTLIWHMEEPYFELGLFLTYCGFASASGKADAVIGGEGADQMFGTGGFAGGTPAAAQYLLRRSGLIQPCRSAGALLRGPLFYDCDNWAFKLRVFWNRATDLNDWYFYGYDELELGQALREGKMSRVPRLFDGQHVDDTSFPAFFANTQVHQDIRHYANENVMVKAGRMADMTGLSLRESFLDLELADFLVSLDYRFKRSGTLLDHFRGRVQSKLLHRKAMEGILPQEILNKPKQGGFVPVALFLGDSGLRQRIYGHLLKSKIIGEYFRADYLTTLFGQYESYQSRPVYWPNFLNSKANKILFLLTFDIWHYLFVDNDPNSVHVPGLSDYLAS
jgi:asparagine synthase (glutamine-hydrolysing)